ncbi:cobalt-precorrin-5B (C(1))-methyltransferase [Caenispirillum bisanense]|uniref:Cobalt-precorrin-5B C(1)-methyltransferase n=1 Tax=Caenispirillum bisanense TaxID=414052 RepID=A0A286GV77_9PROT|nr:cobalt-precorrin-5B (C(1))-methyltransferase [Caenispirillum bisanense]SOD99086.1 cobalt-precorrin-5B (C1)-methyltransferase [Caenispirillum bisanense]
MTDTRPLRKGWTTGACATAAARACLTALRTGAFPDPVEILLPKGLTPAFALNRTSLEGGVATASVIKDAGDDPDVTHGAEIVVSVRLLPPGSGVVFRAGAGVGTVTKPGLPLPPGEPAINPAPRAMIAENLTLAAGGEPVDAEVTVGIVGGEALALKTMNPRLGILGGLSVLGTTGVVVPYSCAAWIHSIHRGIDVARAAGCDHLLAATGDTSERAARALFPVPEEALIDMGDFAGAVLKYLRKHPVPRLTLAGGLAKISKLADGHMDLHSSRSRVDQGALAVMLHDLGAPPDAVDAAGAATTAGAVLEIARALGLDRRLGDLICARAREVALATLSGGVAVAVLAFDRQGREVGRAGP